MSKKSPYSGDPEKLKIWLEEHSSDGRINGEPIIADGYTELRGYVHERDYNDALKLAAPWAGKKAFIAAHGIVLLAGRQPILTPYEINNLPNYSENDDEARFFRGRVSQGTLDILSDELASYGEPTPSQKVTIVLRHFIADSTIQRVYQAWIRKWLRETGLKVDEVEEIIYDYYRVDGAKKRLEAIESNDPEANAQKMP